MDAIVNAANVHLEHGSGVARAISDAAGKQLNDECRRFVKQNGKLKTSIPMHTPAYELQNPIKYIIHVAGPRASQFKDTDILYGMLRNTFENVMVYANDCLCVSSVAIPAISSGNFVFFECIANWNCTLSIELIV